MFGIKPSASVPEETIAPPVDAVNVDESPKESRDSGGEQTPKDECIILVSEDDHDPGMFSFIYSFYSFLIIALRASET